jgi:NADH-quinone oxidoreductase subunit N
MLLPRRSNNAIVITSLLGLVAAGVMLLAIWGTEATSLGGLFVSDKLAQFSQFLIIAITFLTVLYSEGYLREKRLSFGEYYPLVLWSAAGGMIMVTSRDLLIIFLGLEVLSVALYILSGLSSSEKKSQESALKYFLLGAFASSFLLFGVALVYGATGTSNLEGIGALMRVTGVDPVNTGLLYAGIGMILVGFGFKAAVVPFHMWTPDVYQGAPTSVTGFMAATVKVAAFIALARFLESAVATQSIWMPLVLALSVITMTVGNLIALAQRDAKRILAYSSIAHAGYVLAAIAAYCAVKGTSEEVGFTTIAYYLATYGVMTLGAFAVISIVANPRSERTQLEDLYGLHERAPFASAALIVFMASLAGIPPLAGFFGKYLIIKDLLSAGMIWLVIALALNSVISAFYYLRIVMAATVQNSLSDENRFMPVNPGLAATFAICVLMLFGMSIAYAPMVDWMGLNAGQTLHTSR